MTQPSIEIAGRVIGPGFPTYVIAELSANHNQDFSKAVALVRAAKEAGADAVKVQTYTPDTITISSDKEYFQLREGTLWSGRTYYDLYAEAFMPWDWQPKLKEVADDLGLDFFSSPFDDSAVDFLEGLQVPAFKIASFEIVDVQLIRRVAQTGKPVIMSTGMSSLTEIEEAVTVAREAGCVHLGLLKCTSAYPALPEEMNLRTISHLMQTFNVPVGLSDHTMAVTVPVTAVALGACIVEKHFTLTRSDPGPDSAFSLEPSEFSEMVNAIRLTEKALGEISYDMSGNERKHMMSRRSLFIVNDVKSGDVLTNQNVRCIRPGHGLHPRHLDEVLGRHATCDIERGTPLTWELVK